MGFPSEKAAAGGWVVAGITLRAPLKPIYTECVAAEEAEHTAETTTPTYQGSRIPAELACPPPPRKRKPNNNNNKWSHSHSKREFFVTPPDLEAVFVRRHVGC